MTINLNLNETSYFKFISHEEADDALCMQIATAALAHPETRKLRPDELSRALIHTLDESRRRRHIHVRIWSYGWTAYTYAKWSYAAVSVYQHPWIVNAALTGACATGKAVVAATFGIIIP